MTSEAALTPPPPGANLDAAAPLIITSSSEVWADNPVLAGYKHPNMIDWTPFLTKKYIETCDTTVPMKELPPEVKQEDTIPKTDPKAFANVPPVAALTAP